MKRAIILISAVLFTGCTTTKTLDVKAPCPKPQIPARPHLPVQDLKKGDKPDIVMKSYVASLGLCMAHDDSLEHIMKGY